MLQTINENFRDFADSEFKVATSANEEPIMGDILFAMRWVTNVMSNDLESGRITLSCLSTLVEMINRYEELDEELTMYMVENDILKKKLKAKKNKAKK